VKIIILAFKGMNGEAYEVDRLILVVFGMKVAWL
jgi:hypothetical protein